MLSRKLINIMQAEDQCHGYRDGSRGDSVESVGPSSFLQSPKRFDKASNTIYHHCQQMCHVSTAIVSTMQRKVKENVGCCFVKLQQIKEKVASAMFPKFYLIQRNVVLRNQ
ncbi:hypothetical protein VNO78_26552 [Psophocarpus tetragonolobus]|uniref:Uncharacterized protein n=1 Tax=Psophocarpus tetragonolobus TaxID=3891 RepID=A0AAN9RZK1_PSOTE